jgi:hypothetical protein
VRNYESLFIPGLLQTEAYARAVIPGVQPSITKDQIDQRVQARIERQQLLDRDDPLELWAVLDEAAIRRLVGGREIMHAQITHLTQAARRPNVTIQVIPFEAGAHPGMPGSFVHMDFKDPLDPELVYIDTMAGDLFLEADADLRRYRSMFDHLRASASETGSLLTSVAASMKGG